MTGRLAQTVVALTLVVILGWPALATAIAASRESGLGHVNGGGSLMGPVPADLERGQVQRPLRLAAETARLVVATEVLALPIGLAVAFFLFRTDVFGRHFLVGLIAIAALVPLPLHATAWLGALGNAGRAQAIGAAPLLKGWAGAAFVHASAALPWVVLLAGVGLRTVEPELEETALLDLPAWRVVLEVTLRRALGAIGAAAIAVAVLTAGDMSVTDILQIRTYAEEAYLQYNLGNGPGAAAAVALPPLFGLGLLVLLGVRALFTADPARLPSAANRARLWRLGSWRVAGGVALLLVVGNAGALPLYSLIWRGGRVGGRAAAGQSPRWSVAGFLGTIRFAWDDSWEPLLQSAWLAAVGASVAVILAWSLAWLSRRPGVWRWVTLAAIATALSVPGPVAGMGLVFGYRGFRVVYDSNAMVVFAAVLRTFAYGLLILWPAVRTIPQEFLDAAAVDGLGVPGQVTRVALPMTRGATLAAWGVAFVLALGELPATNLATPPGTTPISVVIWGLLHTGVESHTAGVVLVMLGAIAVAGSAVAAVVGRVYRPVA